MSDSNPDPFTCKQGRDGRDLLNGKTPNIDANIVACVGNVMAGKGNNNTRTRTIPVILAGAVFCFGVVLVLSYFYFVSRDDIGSIVHTRVLWGGIMCVFVGAV